IPVIKVLRRLTGCGLAEGKGLSEAIPCAVMAGCCRSQAETARDYLSGCRTTDPSVPRPYVTVELRPCSDRDAITLADQSPYPAGFDVLVRCPRPGREADLIAA